MLVPPQIEKGQGLVEYAMIIIFVALIVLILLLIFGPAVGNLYSNVIESF